MNIVEHFFKTFFLRFKPCHDGTYWWHAHSSNQRTDGIFGSLVVRSNNDPNAHLYDYDLKNHVIVLNDWLNVTAITKYSTFVQIGGDEYPTGILGKILKKDIVFKFKKIFLLLYFY